MDEDIRPAVAEDAAAITAIYRDAVLNGTATYEIDPPDGSEMLRRMRAIQDDGLPWLVAVRDGMVAGYAYAGLFRPRPAYRFALEDSIYVAPSAKGHGLGALLLAALVEEARRLEFRQMIAVIGDGHDASASVRLHRRMGFAHTGRLEGSGYKFGRWLDTVFMQLPLNGGTATDPAIDSFPERRFGVSRRFG